MNVTVVVRTPGRGLHRIHDAGKIVPNDPLPDIGSTKESATRACGAASELHPPAWRSLCVAAEFAFADDACCGTR
jgi:hypothetical protein